MQYILVKLTPKAKNPRLEKCAQATLINPYPHTQLSGVYKAYVKALPIKNQANIELLKLLQKHFKTSSVKIIKGQKSRLKLISIK